MSGLRVNPALPNQIGPVAPTPTPAPPARSAASSEPDPVFFHLDLRRSLQMHPRLALSIFSAALLLASAYLVHSWNRYTAEALVYVQPAPSHLIENSATAQHWPNDANTYESYIQQQIHDVTRVDVLEAAVKNLQGWKRPGESGQGAAERLARSLEVTRVGQGYQLSINARARSAEEAARMANVVAQSYIESSTAELRAGDTQRIQLLREERDRILKELSAARTEQDELNKQLGVASTSGPGPNPIDDQINQVRSELVKARTANDEAAARLTAVAHGASSTAMDAEADQLISTDPGMVSMKTSLNARRSQIITQMANLTPSHPQYKQDEAELAQINTSLDSMTKTLRAKAGEQIQQRLKNDLERTSTVESRLNSQLAQLTLAAGSAAPRLQRTSELAADIQRLQVRYGSVDDQFRNLMLENNAPGAAYLSAAAPVPLHANRGKVIRNALIVLLVGLVLAIGIPLVIYNLDHRIYIAADVERVLGIAPMAQLPDLDQVTSGVADEYMLRLAAAVEHAYQDGGVKSCIFTGVTSGAGTTTIATRVAGMLQAMGRETIFVDASGTPQPVSPGDGTTDLVPVPRGSRSTALLHQMSAATSGNAVVISDTAPLPLSGETEYLARFADSAIVIIESGVTTRTQLREVAQTLQKLQIRAAGFVLNRVSTGNASPSYRESLRAVEKHLDTQTKVRQNTPANMATGNLGLREIAAPAGPAKISGALPSSSAVSDPQRAEGAVVSSATVNAIAAPRAHSTPPRIRAERPQPESPVGAPEPMRVLIPYAPTTSFANLVVSSRIVAEDVSIGAARVAVPAVSPVTEIAAIAPLRGRALGGDPPLKAKALFGVGPFVSIQKDEVAASATEPREPLPVASSTVEDSPLHGSSESAQQAEAPVSSRPAMVEAHPVDVGTQPAVALTASPASPGADAYSVASRLGGLRNLLTSLGMHQSTREETVRPDSTRAAETTQPAERPVYAEPFVANRKDLTAMERPHPASVVAQAEFLPPRPIIETTEPELPQPEPPSSHAVRRDAAVEVDTLPSRRGQYSRRS